MLHLKLDAIEHGWADLTFSNGIATEKKCLSFCALPPPLSLLFESVYSIIEKESFMFYQNEDGDLFDLLLVVDGDYIHYYLCELDYKDFDDFDYLYRDDIPAILLNHILDNDAHLVYQLQGKVSIKAYCLEVYGLISKLLLDYTPEEFAAKTLEAYPQENYDKLRQSLKKVGFIT